MRYNHESYLPIGAFQPILGRMTLHGGGGGGILDVVSDVIGTGGGDTGLLNIIDEGVQAGSDVFAAADDAILQPITAPISQVTSALDDAVVQPITAPISDVGVAIDDAVADVIPGGWGTIAQVAAAATGNPYIIGATSAGVNFAKNKDLESAIKAGLISGGTAGITQGLGDTFQLGDIGKAGLSGGIKGGINYAQTGDVNSALKAGAEGAAMSYGGAKLGEYTAPYLNELKGDFGKYLQDKGLNLSGSIDPTVNVEGAVTSPVSDPVMGQPYNPDPMQDLINSKLAESSQANFQDRSPYNYPVFEEGFEPTAGYDPKANLLDNPYKYLEQKGTDAKDYLDKAGKYLTDTPLSEMPGDLYNAAKKLDKTDLALLAAGTYGLSSLGGGGGDQQSQAQLEEEKKKIYTYGTAGQSSPNYLLKNRINASNVYSPSTGYRPLTRYAEGGDVQHYGIGGKVSDAFTRIAQPFEKAVLRPIGEAVPFVKDLAPYAGMALGAMTANPYVAGAVGGIASGFGKPGGFDFKRAFMGGVASYGMSNLMSGLEAAGTDPTQAANFQPVEGPLNSTVPDYEQAMRTANTPYTAQEIDSLIKPPTISTGTGASPPSDIFRSKEQYNKMGEGIKNLLGKDTSDSATKALLSKAGMYKAGLPLIMGTTGMMGVDESNALKQEYDQATAQSKADEDKFKARVAAGKKRAQQAVSENPYMFAMGGAIDDEYGGDDMNNVNGNMQNGFMGYADGGPVTNAEDLEFMTQLENNRNEVDPMSDARYAGLLKQNQDYLSTIYGNIYNQPTPQPVAPPPPVTVTPSVEPTPLTGAIAPPPPPPPSTVAPLDIETVRANANRALDMSEEVRNNIRDSSRAVERAQELIGTASATPPPPVYQSPNVSPAGQYMVRNPTGPESLNSSNIYQYQKKKRGYAEGGIPRFLSGGGDGMSDSIKAKIEGTQEARLADGEFVIPADVVSHLGNGSSKAGAKQLYDMMDRVRKARTGNPKQGREIKPTKLMPV